MNRPLRGLRGRLLIAFVLVTAVATLTTGALTFREARVAVLQQSQDTIIKRLRAHVDGLAPGIAYPPTQSDLERVALEVAAAEPAQNWRVLATYRGLQATSRPQDTFAELSADMRSAVGSRRAAVFQRVRTDGRSSLVVGLPVTFGEPAERPASGVAVFLTVPQTGEQGYVDALVTAIGRAVVPALGLAVLLALLAARGVLRPVRELRRATRSIAEGHLDTRLAVNGSDELADLSHTFNETAAALEESVAELRRMEARARRFVADVSHELRTPLAAMSAVTDVLDEDAARLDPDTAMAVRLISGETVKLARLVNDLMEISRFDAGAAGLQLDDLDLAESLRRTLAARGWQDTVDTRLPGPGELRGRVDPRRLDVAVANLVGNALRHGACPVQLRLYAREMPDPADGTVWAVIEVTDSGPGIPADVLPHVFDRFYKSDTARTRSEGSGLGLSIAAENVRLHGGTVRAANRPEGDGAESGGAESGGAVFTVEIPLGKEEMEEPEEKEQPGEKEVRET
ncbi:HAMP domain-containing histidine kinase [Streptomyces phaeochromogenes]|uniref:sensor histidine kinase n=1 Tax=Streptomyces phaeochromogenes TaxID=1923 RepID=UPI0022548F94|nr:HAMP domain-containing sensor histidine kinase [Streptomyces phaeochromogenes]MCX5605144.1 HAMP domain-containing histidine kinase [Streptomyces phaeochromogenes]